MKTYVFLDDINKKKIYVKDNRLVNFSDLQERSLVGSLYIGRIIRKEESLNSYLVNFSEDENCLLKYKHALCPHKGGDFILLEISHGYLRGKLPQANERYSYAGDYIILSKLKDNGDSKKEKDREKIDIKFSRKILEIEEKKRLETILMAYIEKKVKEGLKPFSKELYSSIYKYQIKFRSASILASSQELTGEFESILGRLISFEKKLSIGLSPKLLYEYDKNIEEFVKDKEGKIIVNSRYLYKKLNKYGVELQDNLAYTDFPLVNREVCRFSKTLVEFDKSNIVVDCLEALTVIDVNQSYEKFGCKEEMAIRVNLKACMEIANAISLKEIGGIVVIDFIRMNRSKIRLLEAEIYKSLNFFGLSFKLNGFTKSGLYEILIFR